MSSDGFTFIFSDEKFLARPSGALYWPRERTLIVSDLHLGKSTRYARKRHILLPPYEVEDTLSRLEAEVGALMPNRIISLGDSFDDPIAIDEITPPHSDRLMALTARQSWIWITGNHDPEVRAMPYGGTAAHHFGATPTFRHIRGDGPDISGHLHPVYPLNGKRYRCFVVTLAHLIVPAFGSFTGGLSVKDMAFDQWAKKGRALLCGETAIFEAPLA